MKRRLLKFLLPTVALLACAAVALAFYSSGGSGSGGGAVGTQTAPVVTAPSSSNGPVNLSWTASTISTSGHDSDLTYTVARNDGSGYTPAGGTCAGTLTSSTLSCSDTLSTSGSYAYKVTAHFNSWSESDTKTVAVDTVAPTVVSSTRADSNNTSAASVHYTVTFSEPVSGVDTGDFALTTTGVSGSPTVTGVIGSGTTYTVTASTGTGSGTIRLDVADNNSITDAVGNQLGGSGAHDGDFTGGETYTIDKTAPTSSSTGTDSNWHNSDQTAHLSASDAGGSGVQALHYTVDGGSQQDVSASSTDVTVTTTGSHTIDFWATDNAGNSESPHNTITVKIDKVAPTSSSTGTDSNWHNTDQTAHLSGSDTGGSGVQSLHYKVDGGTTQDASAATTDVTVSTTGSHTVEFWATDAAGNSESPHNTITVKVDKVAPTSSSTGTDSNWHNTDQTAHLSASDTGGSGFDKLHYKVDGGATTDVSSATTDVTIPSTIGDGSHTIEFWATDVAGNIETPHNTVTVKIDTTGPTPTISLSNANGAFFDNATKSLYYKGDAAGSTKISTALTDAGSGPASVSYPDISTAGWTHSAEPVSGSSPYLSSVFSWSASPSNPTTYTITSSDALGNTTTTNITFVSDTTAPSGGTMTYAAGYYTSLSVPVTLAGTWADSGSGLAGAATLQRDEVGLLTDGTGNCGTFPGSFSTSVALVSGNDTGVQTGKCYQYRYRAVDNVGNVASVTSTNVAKVDSTKPTIASAITSVAGAAGKMEPNDALQFTFSEALDPATVPSTATVKIQRAGQSNLTIPGVIQQASIDNSYLGGSNSSATGSATVSLSSDKRTITVTLGSAALTTTGSGAGTCTASGTACNVAVKPDAGIKDLAGNAVDATVTATITKLF